MSPRRSWAWNPNTARRVNGCGNPVDRAPAVRDSDGRVVSERRRAAILPPDLRRAPDADDPNSPLWHAENFSPSRMWAGYFEGSHDPNRCGRLDDAIRAGACVAMGSVSGTYSPPQILAQIFDSWRAGTRAAPQKAE